MHKGSRWLPFLFFQIIEFIDYLHDIYLSDA